MRAFVEERRGAALDSGAEGEGRALGCCELCAPLSGDEVVVL